MARIEYLNGESFEESDLGLSLLEMSQKHGIAHMHVCGGTARCSTCRVMVVGHAENVLPRNEQEQRLAERKGFDHDIRLACQARIRGDVTLRRLTLDDLDADLACIGQLQSSAKEMRLAILFSDIRDFTSFSENRLPYDTIHLLNRYFYLMGNAILQSGGFIDKYMGDGIMALFGLNKADPAQICRDAVSAGLLMLRQLSGLNAYLRVNFGVEFRVGIGIHFGEVVLGELGHPDRRQLTVIGDNVNMASRIESATKPLGVELLISEAVRRHLGEEVAIGRRFEAELKGKSGSYTLYEVVALHAKTAEERLRALRQRLAIVISAQMAPALLRLAFHDAGTFSASAGGGGADGSVRLPEELAREENRGLEGAIALLRPIKEASPEVSWADLIALAGAIAVEKCGGPAMEIPLGRRDADAPAPEGRLPARDASIAALKARFHDMGLTTQELVVLSGAHTIGRMNGAPFTDDWLEFSNSYFKLLLSGPDRTGHLLPSDRALVSDPECRQYVEKYARNRRAFLGDFAAAYRRMTLLGTGLAEDIEESTD